MAQLFEDFHLIEPGLYLGNIDATVAGVLEKLKIRCVLTVMNKPLLENNKLAGVDYHFINVDDVENEDILSHFPFAYKVISEARKQNKNVLVHCQAGRSRSVTIMASYLMKKYNKSAQEAFNLIRCKRFVCPIEEFLQQLNDYERWKCQIEGSNREYRRFILKRLLRTLVDVFDLHSGKIDSKMVEKKFMAYFEKQESAESRCDMTNARGKEYTCRDDNCKQILFFQINVVTEKDNSFVKEVCDWIFIEPQRWVLSCLDVSKEISPIKCKGCSQEIGWLSVENSLKCECPLHINIREYLMVKIRRDKVKQGDETPGETVSEFKVKIREKPGDKSGCEKILDVLTCGCCRSSSIYMIDKSASC